MTYPKSVEMTFEYVYDFSVSGGAVSTIPLVPTFNSMEIGLTILGIDAFVETALVGTGAVVEVGNNTSANGYFADIKAIGTLNNSIKTGNVAGSLLWDDTNDVNKNFYIASAADVTPAIKISTAALTAGKVRFLFKCIKFN